MPKLSLVPPVPPIVPDLREVFTSSLTRPTVERVVRYIGQFYDKFTVNEFQQGEEFFLQMPTEKAFETELALCEAILDHARGFMSDWEMKAVLDRFIAAHMFVWQNGARDCRDGDFSLWADCPLVHVYHPENENIAFTCNPIQSWLIYFLHAGENLRVLRLN